MCSSDLSITVKSITVKSITVKSIIVNPNSEKEQSMHLILDGIHYCDYGCGRPATHYFPTVKKWCCSKHYMKCPNQIKTKPPWTKGKKHSQIPWNKGKKDVYSKETLEKMSIAKKGVPAPWASKPMSDETKKKLSKAKMGYPSYWKGKSRPHETKRKISETKKGCKGTFKGKKHSDETKKVLRLHKINQLKHAQKNNYQISPSYNPNACILIDEYGKQHGYNFQHAENGGEYYIKELGYWVDGYDSQRNTVIEIDESHHFDSDGNLSERDVRRQKEIVDHLHCNFIRLRI